MGRSNQSVTVIKVLMVTTILVLFATLATWDNFGRQQEAKLVAARVQMTNFERALTQYKLDTGVFPATEQGLEALRNEPREVAHWDGPYLRKEIPLDPWGHRYVYKFPGKHGCQPDITFFGADGQAGGEGPNADIVSWKN